MSTPRVLDASFTLCLLLPGPHREQCRALVTDWYVAGDRLCAPMLWLYEITSALSKGVHFGQISREEGQRALSLAQSLGVQLFPPDEVQSRLAFDWTMQLRRASAYDSFYLALAQTLDGELWTADKRLAQASGVPWVRLIPHDL